MENPVDRHIEFLGLGNTKAGEWFNDKTGISKHQIDKQLTKQQADAYNQSTFTDNSIYAVDANGNMISLAPGSAIPDGYTQVDNSQTNGASYTSVGNYGSMPNLNVVNQVDTTPHLGFQTDASPIGTQPVNPTANTKPKSNYSWAIWVIGIGAIAGGAYYFWKYKKK